MNSLRKLISCTGKAKFPTYELAAQAAKRKPHGTERPRTAYRCKACGSFHVGGAKPRRATARPTVKPSYEDTN